MIASKKRWVSATAFLLLTVSFQCARADDFDDAFSTMHSDDRDFFSDSRTIQFKAHRWELSVSAGAAAVHSAHSEIYAPAQVVVNHENNNTFTHYAAEANYTTDKYGVGYTVQIAALRQVSDWLQLGVQGGLSSELHNTIEEGVRTVYHYVNGIFTNTTDEEYHVEFQAQIMHLEPMVRLGRWYQVSRYGLKPYLSGGVGWQHVEERVVYYIADESFRLASKDTTATGIIAGGGLDFRFSNSASIALDYQAHRILKGDDNWTVSQAVMRFAYHF